VSAAPGKGSAGQGPELLRGDEALARTSLDEIVRLTEAATAIAFHAEGLTEVQHAANRRVVAMSGEVCADACSSPDRHFAACFVGASLAGFVVSTRHGPGDLELDWLMVHPDHHGAGIAAVLMEEGMGWLGKDRPLWLNVIRANTRAIAFYRKFGFEVDPATATDHAIPHWVMRRAADRSNGSS
jgi:ribosomal protein S18 acetylase RimI-like enzyme